MDDSERQKHLQDPKLERDILDLIEQHESQNPLPGGLYIVYRKNPYFSKGTYVYSYADGFQRVFLVEAGRKGSAPQKGETRGKRWTLKPDAQGLMIPHVELISCVIPIPKPGGYNE